MVGEITANRPAVQEICGKKSAIDVLEKFEGKTLPRLYSAFKARATERFEKNA